MTYVSRGALLEAARKTNTFSDLPKYTRQAGYTVNVPLASITTTLEELGADYGLAMNPDFQRSHVWTPEQQSLFVEYLLRGGRYNLDIKFNAPGWRDSAAITPITLVDGLQRLTAVAGFMSGDVPVFGKCLNEWDSADMSRIIRGTNTITFSVNNLETRAEVLQWYLELNEYGTPHTQQELLRVRSLLNKELLGG